MTGDVSAGKMSLTRTAVALLYARKADGATLTTLCRPSPPVSLEGWLGAMLGHEALT